MNRRRFIRIAGGAIALAGAPAAARAIASADAPKAPAGGWGGFTPNADFYVTTYGSTPRVDAGQWRLKIHGLVKNSLELDLAAVKALPPVNETLTLECIGNPPNGTAIGNATWAGPKLGSVLERARPSSKAVYARLRAADGYTTGIPIDELMRKENFLPYLMNGVPLPPEHGYPLRIFIPGQVRNEAAEVANGNRIRRQGIYRLLGSARMDQQRVAQGEFGIFLSASQL